MREIIGFVMIVFSAIGAICCAIAMAVFRFQNPDMTQIRAMIENPKPIVIMFIFIVITWIGKGILFGGSDNGKSNRRR